MNRDIGNDGWLHIFQKLKNSCRNFGDTGIAKTVGDERSSVARDWLPRWKIAKKIKKERKIVQIKWNKWCGIP